MSFVHWGLLKQLQSILSEFSSRTLVPHPNWGLSYSTIGDKNIHTATDSIGWS